MTLDLREYQLEAASQAKLNFYRGVKWQIISSPTGSGKTEIALHIIRELVEAGKVCDFICDRQNLVRQTSSRFESAGIDHGVLMGDESRDVHKSTRVASAQTLESRGYARTRYNGDVWAKPETYYPDYVIIDECHEIRSKLLEVIKETPTKVIGLTATPFKSRLSRYYHRKLVNTKSTVEMIKAGWLAPLQVVYSDIEIDVKGLASVAGEYDTSELNKRVLQVVGDVVPQWNKRCKEYFGQVEPTIAFAKSIADAEALCREFVNFGFDAEVVSSNQTSQENADIIERFRNGDLLVIVNCAILSRGSDFPRAKVIVDCYPLRKSFETLIQRYGRGLRTFPGKKYCLLLDFAGNWLGFYSQIQMFYQHGPDDLEEETFRDKVRNSEKDIKELKKQYICRHCGHGFSPGDRICSMCGQPRPQRKVPPEAFDVVDGKLQATDSITGELVISEVNLWREMCTAAMELRDNNNERAKRLSFASFRALTGAYPKGKGSRFKPFNRPALPEVKHVMEKNFRAWLQNQKAIEKAKKQQEEYDV